MPVCDVHSVLSSGPCWHCNDCCGSLHHIESTCGVLPWHGLQAAVTSNPSTAVASQAALPEVFHSSSQAAPTADGLVSAADRHKQAEVEQLGMAPAEGTQQQRPPLRKQAEGAQQETAPGESPQQQPQQQQAALPTEAAQPNGAEMAQQGGSARARGQQQASPAPATQQQQGASQAARKAQRGRAKVVERALGVKAGACISKAQHRFKVTGRTQLSWMESRLRADRAALAEMLRQQVCNM